MCPEHVTRTPTNGSAVLLSHVSVCMYANIKYFNQTISDFS